MKKGEVRKRHEIGAHGCEQRVERDQVIFLEGDATELLHPALGEAHQVIRGPTDERGEARVARLLFKLADKTGLPGHGGVRLGLQIIRQDIADMVGCTLETAIRILSRWQKEHLIKTREGVITILNRRELGCLVEPG